jgi:hypothetical protein
MAHWDHGLLWQAGNMKRGSIGCCHWDESDKRTAKQIHGRISSFRTGSAIPPRAANARWRGRHGRPLPMPRRRVCLLGHPPSALGGWPKTHLALSTPKEPNGPRTPNSGRRRHRVRRATSTLPKLGNTRAQASTHTRIGCMQLACHEGISLCRDTRPQRAGSRRFGPRDEAWTRVIRAAAACRPRTVLAYWQLILLNRVRGQG